MIIMQRDADCLTTNASKAEHTEEMDFALVKDKVIPSAPSFFDRLGEIGRF